jgi:hypothetical protein
VFYCLSVIQSERGIAVADGHLGWMLSSQQIYMGIGKGDNTFRNDLIINIRLLYVRPRNVPASETKPDTKTSTN